MRPSPNGSGSPARRGAATGALCALTLALLPLAAPTPVSAQAAPRTITIGESNTAEQAEALLAFFGAEADDPVMTVSLEDTQRAMDGLFDVSAITSAYSSTILTCGAPGSGLEVATRNITVVPPTAYALALATAGIDDASLVVAAPDDAPAEGMTALTGVFATWETSPCPSGATDPARQRLALEGLALIGETAAALGDAGAERAAEVVLGAQRAIVLDGLASPAAIDAAVAAEEAEEGLALPADQRARLVDLLSRLAAEEIDWGTFAAGWAIDGDPDGSSVAMTGSAATAPEPTPAATATAAATAAPTTAPKPPADVPPAAPTATAPAGTTTGSADPTATPDEAAPTPAEAPAVAAAPTATPTAFTVRGKVTGIADGRVAMAPDGSEGGAIAYPVVDGVKVVRSDAPSSLDRVRAGDAVTLTVDGATGRATTVDAEPASTDSGGEAGLLGRLGGLWPLLLVGLLVPAVAGAALHRKGRELARFAPTAKPAANGIAPHPPARRATATLLRRTRTWTRPARAAASRSRVWLRPRRTVSRETLDRS